MDTKLQSREITYRLEVLCCHTVFSYEFVQDNTSETIYFLWFAISGPNYFLRTFNFRITANGLQVPGLWRNWTGREKMVWLFCWLEKLNRWMRAGLSPSWVHRLCTSSSTVISSSCTQLSLVSLHFFSFRISIECCNFWSLWNAVGGGGGDEGNGIGPSYNVKRVLYSPPTSLLF